jgi:hypothetical protein
MASTIIPRNEIVFILDNLTDWQTLVSGIAAGAEVHVLDAQGDALKQMISLLDGRTGLDAIHLLSHGSDGALQLGAFTLSADTLAGHADDLARIGQALSETGDMLLYGCNVGAGEAGVKFIGKVAQLTGADVAASTDATGAAALGGDWVLEQAAGEIETAAVEVADFAQVLPDVVIGNNSATWINGVYQLGQSFTATKTGAISAIKLVTGDSYTNKTLTIYQGEGTSGTVLFTQSGINFADTYTDINTFTYTTVTLSTPVPITSGGVYTFGLNTFFFPPQSTANPYGQGKLYKQGAVLDSGQSDIVFEVVQSDATNAAPTLTSFAAAVASTNEDIEKKITLANLKAQADEADSDGTVDAFVVQAGSTGTLKIGADANSATAWVAGTNATIDTSHNAYWTPASNASGSGLNAFTVVAKDNGGATSTTPVQLQVDVAAVNDAPTIDLNAATNGNDHSTTFASSGPAVPVSNIDAVLADVDSATLSSLTLTLTNRPDGNDKESLSLNSDAQTTATDASLAVSYTQAAGVLSITGTASPSVYQNILRGVVYNNTDTKSGIDLANRTVTVVASDGVDAAVSRTSVIGVAVLPEIAYSATTFAESSANNGGIDTVLTLTLSDDTFVADVVSAGRIVASQVPAGLTPVFTRVSNTVVTVRLAGEATSHANANDISNLGVSFQNGAFTRTAAASGVLNYSRSDLGVDFVDPTVATQTVSTVDGSSATLTTQTGSLTNLSNSAAPSGLPRSLKMPLGQFGFQLDGVPSGGTATLTLVVDANKRAGGFFKQNETNQWVNLASSVNTLGGKTSITFQITDNGPYDRDPTLGRIVDPGGPGQNLLTPFVAENTTFVGDMGDALDLSGLQGTVSYAIGGTDAARFRIDALTGTLRFSVEPDFETRADVGTNNVYDVTVTANGAVSGSSNVNIAVTVVNDTGANGKVTDLQGDSTSFTVNTPQYIDATPTAAVTHATGGTSFANGFLLITQIEGGENGSFSFNTNDATSGGDGVIAGGELVSVQGFTANAAAVVSSTQDGQTGHALRIEFNGQMTATDVEALISSIKYTAPTQGNRSFNLVINDGINTYEAVGFSMNAADNTPPTLNAPASSPADGAIQVAVDSNLSIKFSEPVYFAAGSSGTITLNDLSGAGSVIETFDLARVGTGDGKISVSGDTLTINPAAALDNSKPYAVKISAGLIQDSASNAFGGIADITSYNFTTIPTSPTLTSASYDATSRILTVSGTEFPSYAGSSNDIDVSKLTITGEGGTVYTLTSTSVEIISGTSFSATLNATDLVGVNQIANKSGTTSTGGTAYNLAAATGWAPGFTSTPADLIGNPIAVSNVPVPTITSATYTATTGVLIATGTGFLKLLGTTGNDIDVSKLSISGEGSDSRTLTSSSVEITSATSFTVRLNDADMAAINRFVNKNGTSSTGGTTYNLAAAEDWAAGADAAVVVADLTGNGVTAFNVAVPTITSAIYNTGTGVLVVTGTGFFNLSGVNNDIDISKLGFTGQGGTGASYTLSSASDVEITSATSFTVTLIGADKTGVDALLNKSGASAMDHTTYNLIAGEDWAAGAAASVTIADLTGNTMDVTANTAPTITSGATCSVAENAATSTVVYTTTATDIDAGTILTYSLGGTDAGAFNISGSSGAVTLKASADFETKSSYAFNVIATDDGTGNLSDTKAVTLTITNRDESAPVITSSATATAISENSGASQVVYTASSTDTTDYIIGTTTYSLKAATGDVGSFSINASTGAVTLTGNPDFEAKSSYAFTVVATDAANNASEKAVTLAINNLDEVAPTITSSSTATAINENSGVSQVIYTVTSTDTGDAASAGVSYSLKEGGDAALFSINASTGAVTLTANPNFESKASYAFTVKASDGVNTATEKAVSLAINNVNEGHTGIVSISGNAIESQSLSASDTLADPDGMGSIGYQWYANGVAVGSGASHTLSKSEVGASIIVMASYVDGGGYSESELSAATDSVAALVDGTAVAIHSTTQGGQTTTTQTVAPVTVARSEDTSTANTTLADIPLATDSTGAAVVQVSLPVGVGLTSSATVTASGSAAPTLREQLIAASDPRVNDSTQMSQIIANGIDQYVPTVTDSSQVTVRTITLTVAAGTTTAPTEPIHISGSLGTGEGDAGHPLRQEALVIDASHLPSGTMLDLDNVEFAIIIGPATATGGAGRNYVIGDGSAQTIILGPDDDVLHGGAGNDTVGSKGGNDQLFGDEGNDTVVGGLGDDHLEGGAGNDLLVGGQSDAGLLSFSQLKNQLTMNWTPSSTELADSTGWSNTGNHDGGVAIDPRLGFMYQSTEMRETVTELYDLLLNKLPTMQEMNFWATSGYSVAQLEQGAANLLLKYVLDIPTQFQVKFVMEQLWGAGKVTDAQVQSNTSLINAGGSWGQLVDALIKSDNFKAGLLNADGSMTLTQVSSMADSGWAFDTGNDTLLGGAGNDALIGGRGNDLLDGGDGIDTAAWYGNAANFEVKIVTTGTTKDVALLDTSSGEVDIIRSIEQLQIGGVSFDSTTLESVATVEAYLATHTDHHLEVVLVGLAH